VKQVGFNVGVKELGVTDEQWWIKRGRSDE